MSPIFRMTIIKCISMISRRKIKNDTPFIIVKTLQEFNALVDDPISKKALKKGSNQEEKAQKQTIIIPKYQIIKQAIDKANSQLIQSHYIKLSSSHNLPKSSIYEADEVDMFLVATIQNKFWSGFNEDILIECIQKLEQQAYQNISVHEEGQRRAKQQESIIVALQHNYVPNNIIKIEQMGQQIHRYWLTKKQKCYNYPLIRKYWYSQSQLPFQPRNYEKYQLRKKFTEPNDRSIIEYYLKDLQKVKQILELMLKRETKQKQLHERMLTQYTKQSQDILNRMYYHIAQKRVNRKNKSRANKSKSYPKYQQCKQIDQSRLSETKEGARQSESDVIKIQRLLTNLFFTTYPRDELNLRIIKWASSGYLPFGKTNDASGVSSGAFIRKKFASWKKNQ